jgi:hypothetical protein
VRARLWLGLTAVATVAAAAWVSLSSGLGRDYPGPSCIGCDRPGPPIDALVGGHIGHFFSTQPFMGSVSMLLRAPAVWLVQQFGGDQLWQYRAGALACMLVVAALVWALLRMMQRRGQGPVAQAVVIGLVLVWPLTTKALYWGHPEEPLAAALAVAGVLLAVHRKGLLAGAALGLAVATKQWAIFAILPALLVAGDQRKRLIGGAGVVAAVFVLPMLIGDPGRFFHQNLSAGTAGQEITPTSLWWPFHHVSGGSIEGGRAVFTYSLSPFLRAVARPLMLVLGLGLTLLYWRRSRDRHPYDVLQLLALLMLLRCVLDPQTFSYHHVPFLIALATFEALRRRGVPVVSLVSATALWFISRFVADTPDMNLFNLAYLAWALPTLAYLAVLCFAPGATLSARMPRVATAPR